jgi:hypothetical protein
MSEIGQRYALPGDVDRFVDDGFLEVLWEDTEQRTIEFHIPSRISSDHRGRVTAYRIVWIHPEHNAEFCHFFADVAGDLPNFYVEVCTSDGPDEMLDQLQSDEDLECWLQEFQSSTV